MRSHPTSAAPGPQDAATLPADDTVSENKSVFVRLTLMMLLEFVVFGSWFATFGLVLSTYHLPAIIGTAYSLAAIAAIASPMFLGAIGDRFLAAQKSLGIAHIAGGVLMLFLPAVVKAGNGGLALLLIFVYCLFFQPTLGLANAIGFRHLGSDKRLFPYVRVFGTLGWVVAGAGVGWLGLSASVNVFSVTAIASFVFGLYAFTLPATPPPAKGVRFSIGDVVGSKAFVMFRNRNFAVLMVCALLTSISLGVYNTYASPFLGALGIGNVAGVLSLGQATEVAFIVTIPFVLKHIGMKWALLTGMVMWGIRFAVFIAAAGGDHWLAILAVALQGICNDFFLVLAAMYIGEVTPVELSNQAQNMLIMVVSGFGSLVGAFVSGEIYDSVVGSDASAGPSAWTPIWIVPIVTATITAIVWATLFRHGRKEKPVPFVPVRQHQ
ncbi:nucleoside permease [Amycolatopsis acidicola]|uniref:Nucleoside permease n=1 Tax=Amycolatopsis acidicola TaxID=2596893 RepID=A0A5N0VJA1_9PSEU|nr:MFS transporter [Amycolatopsis acidicola]KAA9165543.1 nucleoside permease [Amycolatopsis acidicola]